MNKFTLFFLLGFIFSFNAYSQTNYYWVGGSGNWSDASTHWATSSGGTSFHSSKPTSVDDVYFDANSFSSINQTVTVDFEGILGKNIDWTSATNTPTFNVNSKKISIAGSLTMIPNMVVSGNNINLGTVFTSTTGSNTITTAGQDLGRIWLDGAGGEWSFTDDVICYEVLISQGILNTQNHSLETTAGARGVKIDGSSISTKGIRLGTSTLTMANGQNVAWDMRNADVVDAASSTIIITGYRADCCGDYFYGGGHDYNIVRFTKSATGTGFWEVSGDNTFNELSFAANGNITGSNTIGTLSVKKGYSYIFTNGKTQSITTLSGTGDCNYQLELKSSSSLASSTLSIASGTLNMDYVSLTNMAATGGATFNVTNATDNGGNTGWNLTAWSATNKNLYWIGGSGNWKDPAHWAETSGGSSYGCVPNFTDNVFFDANSFSATGQTVTVDFDGTLGKNIDWTSATNTPTFNVNSKKISIAGSLTMIPNMVVSGNNINLGTVFTSTTGSNTITTAGKDLGRIWLDGAGGEWSFTDDVICYEVLISQGILNTQNHSLETTAGARGVKIDGSSISTKGIRLGTSTLTMANGQNVAWDMRNANVVDAASSTIIITGYRADCCGDYFHGGGHNYNIVRFTKTATGPGYWEISGNNTFKELSFGANGHLTGSNTIGTFSTTAGYSYVFTAGQTQKITQINASGASGSPIELKSSSTSSTNIKLDTKLCSDYIKPYYLNVTGTGIDAGLNGTNLGGNNAKVVFNGSCDIPVLPFISKWATDGSNKVTLPLIPTESYSGTISWGDGSASETFNGVIGSLSHTYSSQYTYTITITPTTNSGFPGLYLNNGAAKLSLITIEQWGDAKWSSMKNAFLGAQNLEVNATDYPDISIVTDMSYAFSYCLKLGVIDMSHWDVSNVTNMDHLFERCFIFNGDITTWDTSKVTNMNAMFYRNYAFNQNIGNWNTSRVQDMSYMFAFAGKFNQDINTKASSDGSYLAWDVSSLTVATNMFQDANIFNSSVSNWRLSAMTALDGLFYRAIAFNQPLSTQLVTVNGITYTAWDVSSMTSMYEVFREAPKFNQNLSSWDTSAVTSIRGMFYKASAFNQDLSSWDTSEITNMLEVFSQASVFNGSVANWDTSKVTNMAQMFRSAPNFNQDISHFDISSIQENTHGNVNAGVSLMLDGATSFSNENYQKLLDGFATLSTGESKIPSTVDFTTSARYATTASKIILTGTYSWTITDGGVGAFAPVSNAISLTAYQNRAQTATLSATDANGDSLTYSITTYPSTGSASLSGANLSYTPSSTFTGTLVFYYKANDGSLDSNVATITILVKADADRDGVDDSLDLCPNTPSGATVDAHGCSDAQKDADNDGVTNSSDLCPNTPAGASVDAHGCALSQKDSDGDGIADDIDNCLNTPNADQLDTDGDGKGNVCDEDDDNDGWSDVIEIACGSNPLSADSKPLDTDGDGIANCQDPDIDNDGCLNADDALPLDTTECSDFDGDGIGDNTDLDDDNDGQSDVDELKCGSNPYDASSMSADFDGDGILDCIDEDDDNDGVNDYADAFPNDALEWADYDQDGIGNNADTDDDNDGWSDLVELTCGTNPVMVVSQPTDLDKDGIADCEDADIDGDGVINADDAFPTNPNEWADNDKDGTGDNLDVDDDNDGVLDTEDAFPMNASESKDSDGDGVADGMDTDKDNDGFEDTMITASSLLTPSSGNIESKWVIANIEQYPRARVRVYDMHGNEVFSSLGYHNDWNGVFKDSKEKLPAGSYYYTIDYHEGGKVTKGWLYLVY